MSKRTSHPVSSLSASTAKEEVTCGGWKNVGNVIRQRKRRVQNHLEQTSSKGLANSNRYSDEPSGNSWKYPRYLIIKKSSMAWKQRNELPQLALIICTSCSSTSVQQLLSFNANVSSFSLAESPPCDLQITACKKWCAHAFNCFWLQIPILLMRKWNHASLLLAITLAWKWQIPEDIP